MSTTKKQGQDQGTLPGTDQDLEAKASESRKGAAGGKGDAAPALKKGDSVTFVHYANHPRVRSDPATVVETHPKDEKGRQVVDVEFAAPQYGRGADGQGPRVTRQGVPVMAQGSEPPFCYPTPDPAE